MITEAVLKKALPEKASKSINQGIIDKINLICADPIEGDVFKENLLSYASVIQDGRFKLEDYLHAVRYVSAKLTGSKNVEAYAIVFPDRYNDLVAAGKTAKQISSYVAAYNGNKLVNAIYEQTLIPTYIVNADVYQRAINVQAELMTTSNSDKVRVEAANSILNHLKRPEVAKVELDVNVNNGNMIKELQDITVKLAAQQRDAISSGAYNSKEIAHQSIIIDGEVVDE